MKITKRTLQKLIKEEIQRVLRENHDEGFSMLDRGQPSPAIYSQGELDLDDTSPKRVPALDAIEGDRGAERSKQFLGSKGNDVAEVVKKLFNYINGSGRRRAAPKLDSGKFKSIKGLYIHGFLDEEENLNIAKITDISIEKDEEIRENFAVIQLQYVDFKGKPKSSGNQEEGPMIVIEGGDIYYYTNGFDGPSDKFIEHPSVIVEPKIIKNRLKDLKGERNPPRGKRSAKQSEFDL